MSLFETCPHGFPEGQCSVLSCGGRHRKSLPEPPMPKPKRIEFPIFARLNPVRGEGMEALVEAFRVLGITDIQVPTDMKSHPVVVKLVEAAKKSEEGGP